MTYINPTNFKIKESAQITSSGSNVLLTPPPGLGNNFRILLPSITGQLAVVSQLGGVGSITSSNITDFSEAVDDRISNLFVAGTGVAIVYNDVSNTFTVSATGTSGESASNGPSYSKILSYINIG